MLNLLIAVMGPAIMEPAIYPTLRLRMGASGQVAEGLVCTVGAFVLGLSIFAKWRPSVAMWLWIGGFYWLSLGALRLPVAGFGARFHELSGQGCAQYASALSCFYYPTYTIPALRLISYSLGANPRPVLGRRHIHARCPQVSSSRHSNS